MAYLAHRRRRHRKNRGRGVPIRPSSSGKRIFENLSSAEEKRQAPAQRVQNRAPFPPSPAGRDEQPLQRGKVESESRRRRRRAEEAHNQGSGKVPGHSGEFRRRNTASGQDSESVARWDDYASAGQRRGAPRQPYSAARLLPAEAGSRLYLMAGESRSVSSSGTYTSGSVTGSQRGDTPTLCNVPARFPKFHVKRSGNSKETPVFMLFFRTITRSLVQGI